jgi:hypothetical protein
MRCQSETSIMLPPGTVNMSPPRKRCGARARMRRVSQQPENTYDAPHDRLSPWAKTVLLGRTWYWFAAVSFLLRRHPLPEAIRRLANRPHPGSRRYAPARLSRAVSRGLRLPGWQPRCIIRSLVLYSLMRAQGDDAHVVIGMLDQTRTSDAHAWVEAGGRDIGPAPGRIGHRELVRYPLELHQAEDAR